MAEFRLSIHANTGVISDLHGTRGDAGAMMLATYF
jgi:hypothetical protein